MGATLTGEIMYPLRTALSIIIALTLALSNVSISVAERAQPSLTRPISIDLKGERFENFLRIIAETSNMNVIRMEEISFPLTVRLIDTPIEKALDAVLSQYELVKRVDGNVIQVYRKSNPALKRPQTTRAYEGRLISLDLQDTHLDNAVRIVEEVAGKAVLGKELLPTRATVTVRLIDVPWDQVLAILLEQNDLQATIDTHTIQIKTAM